MEWTNAWVFSRCSCPAAHYVAGVCPKLAFLAQWRDKTIEQVAALVEKYNSHYLPRCTGDDLEGSLFALHEQDADAAKARHEKGRLCKCALHYRARAVCPRRNDFMVVEHRDRRDGSQCRTDNYSTGTYPYGVTKLAASLAWTVFANNTDRAERLFTRERPLIVREARDRMLADAKVTWSRTANVRADEAAEPLRVGSPVVVKNVYELVNVTRNGNVTTERKLYRIKEYVSKDDNYLLHDPAGEDVLVSAGEVLHDPWNPTIGSVVAFEVPKPPGAKRPQNERVTGVVLDYEWPDATTCVPRVMATTKTDTYAQLRSYTCTFREVRVGNNAYEVCDDGVKTKGGLHVQKWAELPPGIRWKVVTVIPTRATGAPAMLGAGEYPTESVVVDAQGSRRLYHTASEEIGADVALAISLSREQDLELRNGRMDRLRWLAECAVLKPPLPTKGDLGALLKREAQNATGWFARDVAQRIIVYLCDVARTSETWRVFPQDGMSIFFTTAAFTTTEAEELVRRNCDVLALRARYCLEDGKMESVTNFESTRKEREKNTLFTGDGTVWDTGALVGMCAHLKDLLRNVGVPNFGEWNDVLEVLRGKAMAFRARDEGAARPDVTELQKAVDEASISLYIDEIIGPSAPPSPSSFGAGGACVEELLAAMTAYAQRSVVLDDEEIVGNLLIRCYAKGFEDELRMLNDDNLVMPWKTALLTARVRNKERVLAQRSAAEDAIARIAGTTEIEDAADTTEIDETIRADASLLVVAMEFANTLFVASLGTDASHDAVGAAWAARLARPTPQAKESLSRDALRLALKRKMQTFGAPKPDEALVEAAGMVVDTLRSGKCDPRKHQAVARVSAKFAAVMRCGLYDALVAACAKKKRNLPPRAMQFV